MCSGIRILLLICLSLTVIYTVDGYSSGLDNTRVRRQANQKKKGNKCPNQFDFPCKSGECIGEDQECDGIVDCKDGSDETNSCHRIKCPSNLFRCNYGACINAELECDGKPDCRDSSDESTGNCKNVTLTEKCKNDEFHCASGECIDEDLKCDGQKNCLDSSDESRATCWNMSCPGYTFKCKYGACVNGDAQCNGKIECLDGSDEDPNSCGDTITTTTTTTTTPPVVRPTPQPVPSPGSCVLPQHPEFGRWSIYGVSSRFDPGASVNDGTVLQVNCNSGYKLDGLEVVFCAGGRWTASIGKCLRTCPSIYSTAVMRVTCTYKDNETENCVDAIDGTLAKYQCAHFYEDLGLANKPVHICRDGSWDQRRPECSPVCGKKSVSATTLIVNGTNVTQGDYPWQVALYRADSKVLICGGSLINQRVILTAAHCVTNSKGEKKSKELYMVAVGKYYSKFDDSRDANEAQFSALHALFVSELYKGATQNYLGDIAILITEKTFNLSLRVQPVCVDWGSNYVTNVAQKEYGFVPGWGFTAENKNPSDVLKELKIPPHVPYDKCLEGLPEDYDRYLTHDKVCAGYLDRSTSVCKGDSGGGLVYKFNNRYYISGIVSLAPIGSAGGCDSQRYGLYTNVDKYINFIINKEAEFRPSIQ